MSRVKDMTQGKPLGLLITLAVPLMIGNLGQQLYTIVDAIIVGRGVGIKALASVGAADWTYWLILWVIMAMTQGFATRIAHHFGEGNRERLKKSVTMSVFLCVTIGVVLTIAGELLIRPILTILKTPGDILPGAVSYLTVMFAGTMVIMAYNMAAAILRALGDGRTPLLAVLIAGGINVVLDLLFVMVFHWGIIGAAAATVTAQLLAFLYCLAVIKRIEIIQMKREDWKLDPASLKELCSMGLPLALQHVVIVIGGMVLQSAINVHGTVYVAAFTASNKLLGLMESSGFSFGYAVTTYMAQNFGAGLHKRIRKGMKSAFLASMVIAAGVTTVMLLWGKYILRIFIDFSDKTAPQVLEVSYRYLTMLSIFLFALYLLHVFRSAVQGLGNAVIPLISGGVEFFMRVGAALFLTGFWGVTAIFWAEPLAWIGAAAVVTAGCLMRIHRLR
ncbi:Staphylococcal virulence regulator protein A [uncultured Roseburia sp.]|uniref:Probable multidrug resistance protein NorM n=1 Tax=Brotonthovivens ammoniilytica TaxID=2981725 RepID=A0ABT2TPB3_9FIRM|nr:MATE family efflux transporter [Brotonthovivens ammoniilytica]MCU6763304.1 MATE family efflux transporter [Brotonthovivens ammoniilytica]SCJ12643.1 Staphylococcal virulence regulator protein A [uncultured Roseburia sp.]